MNLMEWEVGIPGKSKVNYHFCFLYYASGSGRQPVPDASSTLAAVLGLGLKFRRDRRPGKAASSS